MQEETFPAPEPLNIQALVEIYDNVESAIMILEKFAQSMIQTLPKLLDAVLYSDFPNIRFEADQLECRTRCFAQADEMAELARVVKNAGMSHDHEIAKTKLKELIREAKRVHTKALQLTNTPREEIGNKIADLYDILLVYTGDSDAKGLFPILDLETFKDILKTTSSLNIMRKKQWQR